MTDKQIIINGVDVSGCDFLAKKDDYCSYSGVTYAYKGQCMCSDEEMCKKHPKCFYKKVLKQLKAKEQECEELKAEIKLSKEINIRYHKLLNNLYTIPIFLQLEDILYEKESLEEKLGLAETTKGLQRIEIEKLKQTLAEIKEFCIDHTQLIHDAYPYLHIILDKINEVIDE